MEDHDKCDWEHAIQDYPCVLSGFFSIIISSNLVVTHIVRNLYTLFYYKLTYINNVELISHYSYYTVSAKVKNKFIGWSE